MKIENEKLITKEFNGVDVAFKIIDGESYVRIDEVAKFCGWTRIAKSGNEVIRWERVNKFLEELSVPTCGHGEFIKEQTMYMLIAKANNSRALEFMRWVADILVQLRKTGVVVLDNATNEAIDFEKKYGKYRIRKTFMNSKDLRADWEQFKELSFKEWKSKRLNGKDRIKLQEIIFDAIQNRLTDNLTDMRGSEMLAMQELLTEIKDYTLKLSNNINGGYKSGLTKKINKLEQQVIDLEREEIPLENFVKIPIHLFSCNYMYGADKKRTNSYNKWINNFMYLYQTNKNPTKEEWEEYKGIDFNKPIEIYIKYVCKQEFDVDNGNKALIDVLFNRIFKVDDNVNDRVIAERLDTCNSYGDGEIYYYIRNI